MLKRIPVSEARIGMWVHRLDGSWLDHDLWRSRFAIESDADLNRLRACGAGHCWIDTDAGLDVAQAPASAAAPDSGVPSAPGVPTPQPRAEPTDAGARAAPTASMDEELHRAARICRSGREAVQALFAQARLGHAIDADGCLPLVNEIAESVARHPGALVSLARLKSADNYSYMHSMAVCALMVSLARQLGMDDEGCRAAGQAGLMHDVGKALMPLEVLNKPGRLTPAEFEVMRTHPARGHDLLVQARGATESMLEVCLHHHERADGRGYPHGQTGGEVTLLARMGAVCDVYDAITSNRPYKAGWDPAESVALMGSWKGQFDDAVFHAFVRSLGIYPTGSLVRMASGRLAVVLEQHPQQLVRPVVQIFFSTKSQMPVPVQRLDLSAPGCTDRIVGRESPERWGFTRLEELVFDGDVLRRSR